MMCRGVLYYSDQTDAWLAQERERLDALLGAAPAKRPHRDDPAYVRCAIIFTRDDYRKWIATLEYERQLRVEHPDIMERRAAVHVRMESQ